MILIFLLIPVGIDVGYNEEGGRICLRIARLTIILYPHNIKSKPKKQKKETKKKFHKNFPDITKDEILDAIEVTVRAMKRLHFHLRQLKLHFVSGFEDPYQTAMMYGYVNAAVHAFALPRLKQADIQIGVDFERESCYVDGYVSVTVRIYYVLKLVCCLIGGGLPILLRRHKRLKSKGSSGAVKGKVA